MLRLGQLPGQGNFDLAGELGVLALLGALDDVPEGFPVEYPIGRALGREDFLEDDIGFVELEPLLLRIVAQSFAGAVRRRRHDRPARRAVGSGSSAERPRQHLQAEVIGCQVAILRK
jgi:hypothetical protein